jgi:hypothetical protein
LRARSRITVMVALPAFSFTEKVAAGDSFTTPAGVAVADGENRSCLRGPRT